MYLLYLRGTNFTLQGFQPSYKYNSLIGETKPFTVQLQSMLDLDMTDIVSQKKKLMIHFEGFNESRSL